MEIDRERRERLEALRRAKRAAHGPETRAADIIAFVVALLGGLVLVGAVFLVLAALVEFL